MQLHNTDYIITDTDYIILICRIIVFAKTRHKENLQLALYTKWYVLFAGVYFNILVALYKISFWKKLKKKKRYTAPPENS